jgi:hypothetical protein
MTKPEGIDLHPGEQDLCGLIRIMVRWLAGFDPSKEQVLNQHAEITAGIVDLISIFMAGADERLKEKRYPFRLAFHDVHYVIGNMLHIIHERRGGSARDEGSGRQGRFDGPLERVDLLSLSRGHGTALKIDNLAKTTITAGATRYVIVVPIGIDGDLLDHLIQGFEILMFLGAS